MSFTVLSIFNCSSLIMSHCSCGTVGLNGPYYYFVRDIDGPHVSLKQHKDHKSYDSAASLIAGKYNIDYQYVLKIKQNIYTSAMYNCIHFYNVYP